jgi:hypothetical protein
MPNFDADLDKLISVAETVVADRPISVPLTLNEVGLMKAICDVYLLHAFNRIAPQRLDGSISREVAQPDLGNGSRRSAYRLGRERDSIGGMESASYAARPIQPDNGGCHRIECPAGDVPPWEPQIFSKTVDVLSGIRISKSHLPAV